MRGAARRGVQRSRSDGTRRVSRYIAQGSKVEDFEAAMRTFFGNQHVLSVNAATSGLNLALHLLLQRDGERRP